MDFTLLEHVKFDLDSYNGTLSVPSAIMEALIPGYRIFHQLIFRFSGIDIGLVVSGCLIVFVIAQCMHMMYFRAHDYFQEYFMSTIYIEEYDDLHDFILTWLASQHVNTAGRGLQAISSGRDDDEHDQQGDVLDEYGIFSFQKWANKLALRFAPWYGVNKFKFEGRWYTLTRRRRDRQHEDSEYLAIGCTGRSYQPIKALLHHIRMWSRSRGVEMTTVFSAQSMGEHPVWKHQATRPSRPLNTISLDEPSKVRIVKDINEYLHPDTARWYAARGIPYRRGYLLYGPPGTGKTSLSFALAGIFGLAIYCVSLNEPTMTESALSDLFNALPQRCIVLLEDIDTAGLRRENLLGDLGAIGGDSLPSGPCERSQAGPRKDEQSKSHSTPGSHGAISLSGLLNVIDGAASQEGRVLIMTTNCPESLDDALICFGCVDFQITFTYATQEQAQDIFTRMYSMENDKQATTSNHKSANALGLQPSLPLHIARMGRLGGERFLSQVTRQSTPQVAEPEELAEMAHSFAVQIPEGKLTPAEIQGYLLNVKQKPSKAVEGVGKWRDALLEAKKKGKKVVKEQ